MKLKRYFATDMRQAMLQMRSELGAEAVILSNREVDGGIEIVGAIDLDDNQHLAKALGPVAKKPLQVHPTRKPEVVPKIQTAVATPDSEQAVLPVDAADQSEQAAKQPIFTRMPEQPSPEALALQALQREFAVVKELFNQRLSQFFMGEDRGKHPLWVQQVKRLSAVGLSPKLARAIADSVHEVDDAAKSWREMLYQLAEQIPIVQDDVVNEGGIIVLLGATGVGKTTTVAKFAGRFVKQHGRDQVALVTTDMVGVGEEKQLQTYGQLLGVPVFMAGKNGLHHVLEGLADKKLILIDTAGMNPHDLRLRKQLDRLSDSFAFEAYLVLPANAQRVALDEMVRGFDFANIKGCIITKIDEAFSLGDVLSASICHQLPIVYVSAGRKIPDDLQPAHMTDLLARAMSLARSQELADAEPAAASPEIVQDKVQGE